MAYQLPRTAKCWLNGGVHVDHTMIYRWIERYAPIWKSDCAGIGATRQTGVHICVDETYFKIAGKWAYLYLAVDSRGNMIDFYLSCCCNVWALVRLKWEGKCPSDVGTDR